MSDVLHTDDTHVASLWIAWKMTEKFEDTILGGETRFSEQHQEEFRKLFQANYKAISAVMVDEIVDDIDGVAMAMATHR